MKEILVGLVLGVAMMAMGITLKDQVYVVDGKVMLSDLTDDPVPSDILIAYAPPPGYSVVLNGPSVAKRIERVLKIHVDAPASIRVLRVSQARESEASTDSRTPSATEVERAVETAVKKELENLYMDLVATEIDLEIEGEISPPEGTERFSINLAKSSRSSFSVLVRYLNASGATLSVDWLKANAVEKHLVWAATRRILAGEVLTEGDATLTTVNVLDLDGYVDSSGTVVGMRVTRSFKRLEPFDPSYLKAPPLVERGTVIMAVFDEGWMRVSTFVRLMEDGYAERFVLARNVQTGRLVYGFLSNDAVLLVKPFPEVSMR